MDKNGQKGQKRTKTDMKSWTCLSYRFVELICVSVSSPLLTKKYKNLVFIKLAIAVGMELESLNNGSFILQLMFWVVRFIVF